MRVVVPSVLLLMLVHPLSPEVHARQCPEGAGYQAEPSYGYVHERFGVSPVGLRARLAAYRASFDTADDDDQDGIPDYRATPEWVAYHIKAYARDAESGLRAPDGAAAPQRWYHVEALEFLTARAAIDARSLDATYRGEPVYERGQLVPRSHADRLGWQAGCSTFSHFNAVPQLPGLRQGIWRHMDRLIGAWANKYGSLWVFAGPVYYRGQEVHAIGDEGEIPVAIPHAFFRIVIRSSPIRGAPDVLAFIYPQWDPETYASGDCSRDGDYPHQRFLVSIEAIEAATGLRFFTNVRMAESELQRLKARKATALWPAEGAYFGLRC